MEEKCHERFTFIDCSCFCVSACRPCVRRKTWRNGSWRWRSATWAPSGSPPRCTTSTTSWRTSWPIRRPSWDRSVWPSEHLSMTISVCFPRKLELLLRQIEWLVWPGGCWNGLFIAQKKQSTFRKHCNMCPAGYTRSCHITEYMRQWENLLTCDVRENYHQEGSFEQWHLKMVKIWLFKILCDSLQPISLSIDVWMAVLCVQAWAAAELCEDGERATNISRASHGCMDTHTHTH